jgi:alkyldihydroxyacetonephosphate synthase
VDLEDGVCEVDTGILGEHLETQLQQRGATLGHFPSSIYCSTVGGWVATRSAGQCSGRYGKIEDMTLAVEGVLGTGEPFHARAPAPGAVDMRALLVGSEGTFGFLTRATLRVWPRPHTVKGMAFTYDTMEAAWEVLRGLYQAGLRPAVTRLYDPFDTLVFMQGAKKGDPEAAPARKGTHAPSATVEALTRRALEHPRALNALASAVSAASGGRCLLLVLFEATREEPVEPMLKRARAIARSGRGSDAGDGPARRWRARRHAVSYRMPPTFVGGLWADTMEVAAPWSRLGALYDNVREALGRGGFVMAHLSHAYPDGCSIYFTFVGGSRTDDEALVTYDDTWRRALVAAHRAGGTGAHHHGVGRSKRAAMALAGGAGVRWLEALRASADPDGVFARGALVPPLDEPLPAAPAHPCGAEPAVDARSRLVTLPVGTTLAEARALLGPYGLSLSGESQGTVGQWLREGAPGAPSEDPVDHLVAGWEARLPSGERAWWQPSPRRSAGPDVFSLLASDGRFGALTAVTLRAFAAEETGPRWLAPCKVPTGRDPALEAWVDRAAARVPGLAGR